MATIQSLSLDELQTEIHVLVSNDSDTPSSSDDDYTIRKSLINQAILAWEGEREVQWRDLWTTETSGGTVAAGTTSYAVSATDFKFPGGYIILDDGTNQQKIKVIPPRQAQKYTSDVKLAYFTGNPKDGWTVNLLWTPATGDGTVGSTIKYDYFKYATKLDSGSDVSEISDPMFIVYYVAAELKRMEDDFNSFSALQAKAANALQQMRIANNVGYLHEDFTMEDDSLEEYGIAFGA